jgi:competence protein ComEC
VPLIYLSCAWVAGILAGAILFESGLSLPFVLTLTGLIPLPLIFLGKHRRPIILTSLCLAALFGGAACFQASQPASNESHLQFYNDQPVIARGMISADPEVSDKSAHLRLSATGVKVGGEWRAVEGNALLFVPRYAGYEYGDVLLVTGELQTPPRLDDFDYQAYLEGKGIYSTMLYPEIEVLERGQGNTILAGVYSLRDSLSQTLAEVLPEPQASLAQAIVLGKRDNISSSTYDTFSQSGTAHLLAISGLHLSIVAGILLSLGIWLFGRRRYIYIWLALAVIWLYALLTGMHPPVMRGAIMASLFLTAELLGRQRSAIVALAFAAAIMVGVSPRILWTASFQLSFLAMTGLIFIASPLTNLGRKGVTATLGEEGPAASLARITADSFGVTLAAIIAVWPVIAYYFGVISFVAPLATLLALPALPAIIITGALAGCLGSCALPLGYALGWLAWPFLSYMLVVVSACAAIPLSHIQAASIDIRLVWAYYIALALVLWVSSRQRADVLARIKSGINKTGAFISKLPPKWVIPPLLVVAILTSVAASSMPDDGLHVSFLDVGQGDAILIQQGSQDILVDGGPSPQAICLELGKRLPFWDRTIELVVLTHPSADHLAGLLEVINRYEVKQVLYPDLDFESGIYQEWLRLLAEKDIKYTLAQAGQQVDLGEGAIMKVLNPGLPFLTGTQSDVDNNGMVLHLSTGQVSFLFTADIMCEAELELITRRAGLSSTVLKVAHHGSDTSTTPEFLAVVNPELAVISVGKDNHFGHPTDEVMERLKARVGAASIYRTDEQGTIEFITDGKRLWVRTER